MASQTKRTIGLFSLSGLKSSKLSNLPASLGPRGLSREQAAAYINVSPSLFDAMVKDGRMPEPKEINRRRVWDVRQLDMAFDALPGGGLTDENPLDKLLS